MEDVVNPWQGRRVFVTGHTGFKGGWLSLWLAAKGAQIRGYALDPASEPNLFTSASVGAILDDVRGDVRDYAKLEAAMTEFCPDVIFHLAAQPLVRRSYIDPLGTYATNVMGTAHVLEAIRKTPSVRAVVCITTDKCYQNQEWVWPYRETDPLGGYDPYASSKACAEIVSAAYRSSFFPVDRLHEHQVALATARAGNVIGGGDWAQDRLVPDCIAAMIQGRAVEIRNPAATRPWQHVLEPLHGYLMLAQALCAEPARFARAWNFGPAAEDIWPVAKVVDALCARWGDAARWTAGPAGHLHEAGLLAVDASLARAALGWAPVLPIGEALAWTVAWYRAHHEGRPAAALLAAQIAQYTSKLEAAH